MSRFTTALLFAAVSTFVAADFVIYDAAQSTAETAPVSGASFFASAPSCDDVYNTTLVFYTKDVSGDKLGVVCEGCTGEASAPEYDITSFEVNLGPDSPLGSFTISKETGYTIIGADGAEHGSCVRVTEAADDYDCTFTVSTLVGTSLFECTSDLTV